MLYAGKSRHLPVKAYGDLAEEGDAIAYGVPAEGDSDSSDYEADEEIYGYVEGAHRKNPHPGLSSAYLIPGGRLLLTVDKTWLVLWDLGPPGETDKPAILSKHQLDSDGWFTILNVSMANDDNTLQIVIHEYLRRRLPPYVDPSRVMLGSDSRHMVSALHRFELRLSADGEYALQCLGRLCVVDEDEFEADHMVATQCAHQVALKTDSGRIILWDTLETDGTVVFWEAPESYVLFIQLGYLMTVTEEGVQAIDLSIIPRDTIDNGLVDLRTSSAEPPSTSQSIKHPVDLGTIEGVTVPPSIRARGPVRYDMEVKEPSGHEIDVRFSLDFCPDVPSSSNLTFLGKRDEGEAQMETWSSHWFESVSGYWGCVWEALPDVSSIHMTIYARPVVVMGSKSGDPQDGQELQDSHNGEYTQEEESGRDEEASRDDEDSDQGSDDTENYDSEAPIPIMAPENQSTVIEDVHICPFSGRVVFLWDRRLVDDVMLEIVDYL